MTRGRTPDANGPSERILAVLKELGTDKENRPISIRSAELAERAKVNHGSLSALTQALEAKGLIIRCKVQPTKGNATYEHRLGPGVAPPGFTPLNTKRAGVALGTPGKLLPVTTPAPAPSTPKAAPIAAKDVAAPVFLKHKASNAPTEDTQMLERLQQMPEGEFIDYLQHLARVWSWGRAQQLVAGALSRP